MKNNILKNTKSQQVFTFVETLVSLFLIVFIGLLLIVLQHFIYQSQIDAFQNYINIDQTNSIVQTLIRELRNIRLGEDGAYHLVDASDQQIVFFSDIDYDGEAERVKYYLTGTDLYKSTIEPVGYPVTYPTANEVTILLTKFVRNGVNPIFYYYNDSWPTDTINNPLVINRLAETKIIRVYLELNSNAGQTDNFVLESFSQPRMLKDNL